MPVEHSAEIPVQLSTGISTVYDTFGDESDPTLVLVSGLSCPMTFWPEGFCEQLAASGFRVVRFDNRDVGRATKLKHLGHSRSALVQSFVGRTTKPPYTISDMADDVVALLDALDVEQAHLAGQSMGGFIVQTAAIEHPDRVLSISSISSSTGSRKVGRTSLRMLPNLLKGGVHTVDDYVASSLRTWSLIGSPATLRSDDELADQARSWYERGYSASGILRQMQAVVSQPDRSRDLARVNAPVLVVHGTVDRMVGVSGGRATSSAVPGSHMLCLPDLGHDLPDVFWPEIVRAVAANAARA